MLENLTPETIKALDIDGLEKVAEEVRALIIDVMAKVGGHVGPNLGIVETAVALHKVFDSPYDKLVWDVSHQSLPHKVLTGRYDLVKKFHQDGGASAFTNPAESEHDFFTVGHTSTSVSLACGLAKGRDIAGGDENIVAIIGDGSLSGGEAFEGLNIGSCLKSNLIVIVNDNEMSIDFNAGGLYSGLAKLRATKGEASDNFFKALGFDYRYVENGNSVKDLVEAFESVRGIDHPTVIHIHTKKGLGVRAAEENPELWHYHTPFDPESGETVLTVDKKRPLTVSFTDVTIDFIANNDDTVAIIPGSPLLGRKLQETVPERYIDVGIAEQSAVAFASALALRAPKTRPFMVIASTFLQRAYDQVIQDWTLNNTPATLIVLGGAITASDSAHTGTFDIPMLSNIPNLVYLSPSSEKEYLQMLNWSKSQPYPVAIRISGGSVPELENWDTPAIEAGFTTENIDIKGHTISGGVIPKLEYKVKSEVVQKGKGIAILGLGMFRNKALEVASLLEKELEHSVTVINPRFISHLDEELLTQLENDHQVIISLEDGILEGGFGYKVADFYAESDIKVILRGAQKEYIDSIKYGDLMERYRLNPQQITEDALALLNS